MGIRRMLLALAWIIVAFSLAGCGNPVIPSQIESGRNITFFITSDIHYFARDLTDGGEAYQKFVNNGDGKQLNYIDEILRAFSRDIQRKKPDVLIVSGDLTTNGEKESHLKLAEKLLAIKKMGTSVFVIPGNHDIDNPYARSFKGDKQYLTDYISAEDFERIYGPFGYDEAVSRDRNTLSYLAAPSKDVWLLMLDTAQYANNIEFGFSETEGLINPKTFDWIKKCSDLAKRNHARIVTVMHHNLLDHSDVLKDGYTLNNSKDARAVFQNCGLDLVLTGHIHLQDIKSTVKGQETIYDIATGALGMYPQKYGVLQYSPAGGFDYSTVRVDVEGWSKEAGIKDYNLNHFKEYSRKFFGDQTYTMTLNRLKKTGGYTDEEISLMAETAELVKIQYFEGTDNLNKADITDSPGFKLWEAARQGPSRANVMRMVYSDNLANNQLHIPLARNN